MKPLLIKEYIGPTEADLLVEFLKKELDCLKCPGDGGQFRSRVLRYGHDYDVGHLWLRDIPKEVGHVWPQSNAVTVNLYKAGHGIQPHVDSLAFGPEIRILSLGAKALMRFTNVKQEPIEVVLENRSMLFLTGELRTVWKHEVVPSYTQGERISVVYRTY